MGRPGGGAVHLTARERILLHLFDASTAVEALEVTREQAQDGIADGAVINLRHVPQYLRPLLHEGHVRERRAHVKGIRQRRKVYELTGAGRIVAVQLRRRVQQEVVRVRDERGVREASVQEVLEAANGRASLSEIIRQVRQSNFVDLTPFHGPTGSPLVEMLSGAPQVRGFVGRERELAKVADDKNLPHVFVVRGIPGIGKSWFGAKAGELLRERKNVFWHRIRPWETPQSILSRLGDFLAALGKPASRAMLARDATAARRLMHQDLRGANAFLVFDDAHDASPEVLSLLGFLKEAVCETPDDRMLVLTRRGLPFYDRRDVALSGLVEELEMSGLGTEELKALLPMEARSLALLNLGRKLGGHPLLLELSRSVADAVTEGDYVEDVDRFLEEAVSRQLSEAERRMMKIAALYRVAVPREALFAQPDLTHDLLASLVDKALIQSLGPNTFEVHDAIREFFASRATPGERREFGAFAVEHLRRLAGTALERRELTTAVGCLSNAIELSSSPDGSLALWEALGDTYDRLGDLPATLTAYKEALRLVEGSEAAARLHRKSAFALVRRGEMLSATAEIQSGFRAAGDLVNVERAWLDLLVSRVSVNVQDWREARSRVTAALQVFRLLDAPLGEAEALLVLGYLEMHASDAQLPHAERWLKEALDVASSFGDSRLTVEIRWMLAHFLGYHCRGRLEDALDHVAAATGLPEAETDPITRFWALMIRGQFEADFQADFSAAESSFLEASRLARKTYDAWGLQQAKAWLATVSYFRGRVSEARLEFERLYGDISAYPRLDGELRRPEDLTSPAELLWQIGECCLLEGDFEGFRKARTALDDPRLASPSTLTKLVRAIDLLLGGNRGAALEAFEDATQSAEKDFAKLEAPFISYPYLAHLYHAVGLRVMGQDLQAEGHIARAKEILEGYSLKAISSLIPDLDRRLTDVLRRKTA